MTLDRAKIQAKINYLEEELESLRNYFFVAETYDFLLQLLDQQKRILKEIEVQECFEAIDSEE